MAPLGTPGNPHTSVTAVAQEHHDAFCKCFDCGIVARCTPTFDFFVMEKDGALLCFACVQVRYGQPIQTVEIETLEPPRD
jgi:hypothetical protein